jgi:hypothetical protein
VKKSMILAAILAATQFSSFAEENQAVYRVEMKVVDFFGDILGPRIEECRNHFDIEPYFNRAIGTYMVKDVPEEVLENYSDTGLLTVPEEIRKDPVGLKCVAFVEGMMAGGTGRQMLSGGEFGQAGYRGRNLVSEKTGLAVTRAIKEGLERARAKRK